MKRLYLRLCEKCKSKKDDGAFVGARSVCRICWNDLSKEEKEGFILCRKQMDRKKTLATSKFLKYRLYTDPDVD